MLVTLTTDFGAGSSYVAAMKGALFAVNPAARPVDLSHDLPPQDLTAAAYFLAGALPWFPSGTIHVVVVDPGVGTDRALLGVEWNGGVILAPDNGCWTPLVGVTESTIVRRLAEPRFWRPEVSATFHGRDILAPVAGHLSLGVPPADLGPRVTSWRQLSLPEPVESEGVVRGEVVVADRFGNLVTNVPARLVPAGARVAIGRAPAVRLVRTYGDAEPGTVVALIGSGGRLEVAVVNGSAAARLGAGVGATVEVRPPG
jgi:S-adenosyl-L-methionine hydrolase (adenosine-forming)